MANLGQVIFFAFLGGMASLTAGFFLLFDGSRAKKVSMYATPFAAGALLAAAFVDLLPEAVESGDAETALFFCLIGVLVFFLLERFLHWFHHHHEHEESKKIKSTETIPLIIVGDSIHNFIDGIVIAAGFLVSVETGVIVTIAVAAHEIPQEIGDFGLLLSKGMHRRNVLLVNFISALITVFAAAIFFQTGQSTISNLDALLGLVAGFFIYIATSDIIPTIHKNEDRQLMGKQTFLLILGVVIVAIVTHALHSYAEVALL